jgi:hypothetical protein
MVLNNACHADAPVVRAVVGRKVHLWWSVGQRMETGTSCSRWSCSATVLIVLLIATIPRAAESQTTTFTYQGQLDASGAPADGSFDLRFGLFSAVAGGGQIGSSQTKSAVAISNGIFTVQLDFGVNAFPGADRFLEIAVRPAGTGEFTILAPRQQISSTPYAIRTLVATNAEQLGGLPASRYVQSNANGLVGIGTANPTNGKLSVDGGSGSAVYGESTTGRGVWGKSVSSRGVYGESQSFQGVFGISGTQAGVAGESTSFHGVFGISHDQNSSGVYGTNDNGGFGVTGIGETGAGVYGKSTSGPGILGESSNVNGIVGIAHTTGNAGVVGMSDAPSGFGVRGESTSGHAIVGEAHSTGNAGVLGTNDASNGFGLRGLNTGAGGGGVYGEAATGRGVWGKSVSSRGVYGESATFQGVFGMSNSNTGVHGESTGPNGFGVYAKNPAGFAIGAEGNATQNRDKGGWVKAMLLVGADATVLRCFTFLYPDGGASQAGCGMEVIRARIEQSDVQSDYIYLIDFPFQVYDRFVSITAQQSGAAHTGVNFDFITTTTLRVMPFVSDASTGEYAEAPFMVIVF